MTDIEIDRALALAIGCLEIVKQQLIADSLENADD